MSIKIYKVITNILCQDNFENSITVKVFTNENLAKQYYKGLVEEAKNKNENSDDYTIDETETSFERYLDSRAIEDSLNIWIEEDEVYESLEKSNDMEKDYDI